MLRMNYLYPSLSKWFQNPVDDEHLIFKLSLEEVSKEFSTTLMNHSRVLNHLHRKQNNQKGLDYFTIYHPFVMYNLQVHLSTADSMNISLPTGF